MSFELSRWASRLKKIRAGIITLIIIIAYQNCSNLDLLGLTNNENSNGFSSTNDNDTSVVSEFFDSFESANLSATNVTGFEWGATNYTSVVTMRNNIATVVYNGSVVEREFSGLNWSPHEGQYALRFRFPAGGSMAEQRFSLGQHYTDVWISYWIRVPENFSHGSGNNKFLAVWTNNYDGPGDVTFQTRPTNNENAKLVVQDGGVAVGEVDVKEDFILTSDRGRWMKMVYRFKAATGVGTNDGIIQVYRRWEGQSQFEMLYNKTNASFSEGGFGIHEGYLMGWANASYAEDTDWLIDQFAVSTEPLAN